MAWRRTLSEVHTEYRRSMVRAAPFRFAVGIVGGIVLVVFGLATGEVDLALLAGGFIIVASILFALAWKLGEGRRRKLLGDEPGPIESLTRS